MKKKVSHIGCWILIALMWLHLAAMYGLVIFTAYTVIQDPDLRRLLIAVSPLLAIVFSLVLAAAADQRPPQDPEDLGF